MCITSPQEEVEDEREAKELAARAEVLKKSGRKGTVFKKGNAKRVRLSEKKMVGVITEVRMQASSCL
jgi:hypothetical protein